MTCVLVVEDDPWIQWMIADDLADRGHTVLTACDGKEALERLRGTPPEVIVLDLLLPRVDGWEFARRYRTITGASAIPIVVVSAPHAPELAATPGGIVRWLSKPFDMEQLASTIVELGKQVDAPIDVRPTVPA
jgi:CheY-like chemotaxis protein